MLGKVERGIWSRSDLFWVRMGHSPGVSTDCRGMQRGCPGLSRKFSADRTAQDTSSASPQTQADTAKAFVTPPPSKTRKLKQSASFMHLEKQRKPELKTGWCLCLHVSA